MKNHYFKIYIILNISQSSAGFTLIELLVAMAITSIVVSLTGFGLVAMTNKNKTYEAQTRSRIELSRASDFIIDEIRMARRINTTTNTTLTAGDAAVASNTAIQFAQAEDTTSTPPKPSTPALGIDLNDLSARNKIVLYLEIPITVNIPTTCPTGGPNPGSAPPSPSTYDRVVYDIRTNTTTWLPPRVIYRYGRIPSIDGTINPCSSPVASAVFVDSISATNINPTCNSPAVLSGAEGFYACVNGRLVDLYLRGTTQVNGVETELYNMSSKGFSRVAP
jgi:prepilin-type N-terminal cleavage/methylation domain-containing protein